jgi:esterase/lipase superfamily enzyme
MGSAEDFESWGMIDVVADLIDGGRVKLYAVDSYDTESWSNKHISLEERARRHGAYESWIFDQVVPWIFDDCGGPAAILTTGTSMGAFHAANFALKRGVRARDVGGHHWRPGKHQGPWRGARREGHPS